MSSPAASCHIFSSLSFSLSLCVCVARGYRPSDHRGRGCLLSSPRERAPGKIMTIYTIVLYIWENVFIFPSHHHRRFACVGSLSLSQNAFWLQNEPPSKGKETRFRRRRRPGKRLSSVSFVSFDDRETLCERTHTRQNRYRA